MAKDRNAILDLKDLESTALLDFYQIFPDEVNDPDFSINIHGGANDVFVPILWQGVSYMPIPLETSDFETKGDNSLPRPKIKIANVDLIFSQYLKVFDGLLNAKVVRHRVFAKYIDAENFPELGYNPFGDSDSSKGFQEEIFYINRKTAENQAMVEFEMVSSLELENIVIPRRVVLASYCPFTYRGDCCGYKSTQNFYDKDNNPLTILSFQGVWSDSKVYYVGDLVFRYTRHKLSITPNDDRSNANDHLDPTYSQNYFVCKVEHSSSKNTNPYKREDLWARDECPKTLPACKMRQGNTIRFGGFPGTYGFGV